MASRTTGTPPAGDPSTAGSSSSPLQCSCKLVGDGSRSGGVGGEPAQRARGQSPLCANKEREALPYLSGPRSGPSFLDTNELTRPTGETRAPGSTNGWLERVGELTAEHREQRAKKYAMLARRRAWKCRNEGFSDIYAKLEAKWYTDRERGQRERPARVAACGAEVLQVSCVGCGTVNELRSGCRIALLCFPCRSAIAVAKRAVFRRARAVAIRVAIQRGLFNDRRRGGRWSEKLLTLTAPHFSRHTVAERIEIVMCAWARFLRLLNDFWKTRFVKSADWFRVFEWTPGKNGRPRAPALARLDFVSVPSAR